MNREASLNSRLTGPGSVMPRNEMPAGSARHHAVKLGRIALYVCLLISCAFYLVPLLIMISTSLKPTAEIASGNVLALPQTWTIEPWIRAWSSACIGLQCGGISTGFWNSVAVTVPSTVLSVFLGALTGYSLTFWRVRGANFLFSILLLGAFLPGQVFIYPLLRLYSAIGIRSGLTALVLSHAIFGLPMLTLLFRGYFSDLPYDLFRAARVDGVGYFQIFLFVILPMSLPIIVVSTILKITWVWNDYIIGVVFGGLAARPMTVQLLNLVTSTDASVEYNVNMAATMLTSLVPLLTYLVAGRWFVRGITAGAVKG